MCASFPEARGWINSRIASQILAEALPWTKPRGIVMCAGGRRLLANAYIALHQVRRLSRLPVEIFHAGDVELPPVVRTGFEREFADVTFRDIGALESAVADFRGFHIKPFALLHTSFREALFLDADNVALEPLDPLFELEDYRRSGALFWPDVARPTQDSLFEACGLEPSLNRTTPEFETGQLLLDRARCAHALRTTCLLNADGLRPCVYARCGGDAGTFRIGFHMTGAEFGLVARAPARLGAPFIIFDVPCTDIRVKIGHALGSFYATGLLQHHPDGRPWFAHKTVMEWLPHLDFRTMTHVDGEPSASLAAVEALGYGDLRRFNRRYGGAFPWDGGAFMQGLAKRLVIPLLDLIAALMR